jgi:hypothetical protein
LLFVVYYLLLDGYSLEFGIFYLLFIVMASFDLSWTPAGSLITVSQQVQYKESISSTWLVAATLSASANSYTAAGLADNTIYDFRIVTDCAFGGPTPGASFQIIDFVPPEVTITPTFELANFSFVHLGGSITGYEVRLFNDDVSELLDTITFPSPSGTIMGTFTGLDPSTDYFLQVVMIASPYSEEAPLDDFTTAGIPSCATPSNVTVELFEPAPD